MQPNTIHLGPSRGGKTRSARRRMVDFRRALTAYEQTSGNSLVSTLLAIALVTTGVPLLMLAAQQRHRRPAATPLASQDWQALQVRHAPTDKAALALLLLSAGLATLAFTVLLGWLGTSYQAALPPGLYRRLPQANRSYFL